MELTQTAEFCFRPLINALIEPVSRVWINNLQAYVRAAKHNFPPKSTKIAFFAKRQLCDFIWVEIFRLSGKSR